MTSENDIMLQVQAGRVDQLSMLYENNKVRLYNYFLRLGNAPAVSEDLVQETFMRVLAYRSSFKGDSSFRTWLYSIARNTASDNYRKNKHSFEHDEFDDNQVDTSSDLKEQIENEEKHSLFEKALQALSPEQRDIIVLSRFQQLKYEEIAEMMNVNLNTFKARMRSAIGLLQKTYQQMSGEAEI